MKGAAIVMLAMLAALVAYAAYKGDGSLGQALTTSAKSFARFLPVLAIAFLLMGFADTLLPQAVVERWLTDASGLKGMGIAWLAGVLTPGGSIIGMPLVAALAKAGVGPGVLVTYLVSLATMSVMRAPLEVGFYGLRLTVLRIIACALVPFIAGGVARVAAPYVLEKAGEVRQV